LQASFRLFKMALNLPFLLAEITDQYCLDDQNRPWVLGFSGGKDSTLLLQLVWKAVQQLPATLRHRPVYVVSNDTLVENPRIARFIEQTLCRIEAEALAQDVPFRVQRTVPALADSFWVNLIGKGYPAPSSTFRWCTDRLKINPTTLFIKNKVSEAGEVIVLLGTRSDESANRARSMKKYATAGQRLRKHVLANAYVFAPIHAVETEELWQYLMQVSPPWGGTHRELVTLYRNASTEADCPLVIDTDTPSCGKSRFGCWVCTVVARDRSMEGLISNGETWMEPLGELRDYLVLARDTPTQYRQKELRRGYIREEAWGPYLPEVRADVLRRLLQAQHAIQTGYDETMRFISYQELVAIQAQWHRDGLFGVSVAEIYNAIYPGALPLPSPAESRQAARQQGDLDLLREICADEPAHFDLIMQTMQVLRTEALVPGRRGKQRVHQGVEHLLDQYLTNERKKK
jgi:DNA sulfur modification protein DndC